MRKLTVWSIWAYLFLLIFEGALRKWVLPGVADVLLGARAPFLLLAYVGALGSGLFPRNLFIAVAGLFCLVSVFFSILVGQTHPIVIGYGIYSNYFQLPLIWVMAAALTREDVHRMSCFLLISALATTVLMVLQYESPRDAWVNRGVGGSFDEGIYGAQGKNRPPGFFAFTSGIAVFFPIAAACFLFQSTAKKRLWLPLLAVCGIAIVLAIPLSISRGNLIATGFVFVGFIIALIATGQLFNSAIFRFALMALVLMVGLSFLPIFANSREVFMARWDTAAQEAGGQGFGSLYARVMGVFDTTMHYFNNAPFFGQGIGLGTNVAAKFLYGERAFLLAEDEWGRCVMELGPLAGVSYLGFRVVIGLSLLVVAWRHLLRHKDSLPFLLWFAAFPTIVFHQWGLTTISGFAIIGGGLVLAATNLPEEDDDEDSTDDEEDNDEEDAAKASELERERRRRRGLTA